MSATLLLTFSLSVFPLLAEEVDHCAVGCPTGSEHEGVIVRKAYTLNNNRTTKFANWVAYKITKTTPASGKPRHWRADPDLPAEATLKPADYKNAHHVLQIDRGHQAPLGSLAGIADWKPLNYLSNITPQKSALNQGSWAALEEAERRLVKREEVTAVYTVTGPLFEREMGQLPATHKKHNIPSGYWKVIFINHSPTVNHYAAFLLEQTTPRQADFCEYQVTIDEIENRSGLIIWSGLPEEMQKIIKEKPGFLPALMGCSN